MPYSPISCADCGVSVIPTSSSQLRCDPCREAYRKADNIARLRRYRAEAGAIAIGTVLTCGCGATFAYTTASKKRCETCRDEAWAIKAKAWRMANKDKLAKYRRNTKDKCDFGGNREAALARDGYQCVRCGDDEDLTIHHKDGQGTTLPKNERNNALDNLETLCRSCHSIEHHQRGDIPLTRHAAALITAKSELDARRGK